MRWNKRKDANHNEIRDHFIELLGPENVMDCFRFGEGFPDLVIQYNGHPMLIEVKTPTGTLTNAQERCKLNMRVVRTKAEADDAVRVLKTFARFIHEGTARELGAGA